MDSDEEDLGVDFQFETGVTIASNECLRIFLSGRGSEKDLGIEAQQCAANAAEIAAKTLQTLKVPEECYGTTGAFSKIQARSNVKRPAHGTGRAQRAPDSARGRTEPREHRSGLRHGLRCPSPPSTDARQGVG